MRLATLLPAGIRTTSRSEYQWIRHLVESLALSQGPCFFFVFWGVVTGKHWTGPTHNSALIKMTPKN